MNATNSDSPERLDAFRRYVAGKRVVVVGNSEAQFGQSLGAAIDRHDCVVRMNLGLVREPRHQGSRTDIVLSSTDKLDAATIARAYAPDWVMWATPKRDKMPADLTRFGEHLVLHPLAVWESLYHRIAPARPSTGLIALNFFRNHCDCAELSFAGFDFFASGTFYNRRFFGLFKHPRKASKPHDGDAEARLVAELIAAGGLRNLAEGR